jgi:sphingoid base N-stearoyltransferase
MEIPFEIKWLYFIECGFYVHSVYATIYMDTKRKDFLVMLIHHFLTMTLIIVTYATRYQKVGVMVLFVHDITDILLEFTKCNVYLRKRNGKFYSIHEYLSNCFFIIFTLVWFVFRLYWFPLKILYTSSVVSVYEAVPRGAGLYTFLNSLMWFLLGLNLYWFYVNIIIIIIIIIIFKLFNF